MIRQILTTTSTEHHCGSNFLIISDEEGGPVNDVCEALVSKGVFPAVFNPSLAWTSTSSLSLAREANLYRAHINIGGSNRVFTVFLDERTRIWCRKPQYPGSNISLDRDPEVSRFIRSQYRVALDSLYSSPAIWMNNPFEERRIDQNKLLQMKLASKSGMQTIPTLCTDDPDQFRRFITTVGSNAVAIKSTAAWMAELEDADVGIGTYTRRVSTSTALALAESVRRAPVLVQPYVDKQYELRVTIVGDRIFACRIESQSTEKTKVDWRHYDLERTPHSPSCP